MHPLIIMEKGYDDTVAEMRLML